MKTLIFTTLFLAFTTLANAQGFAQAEYFFDTDPGTGNGITLPFASPADAASFAANISTTALPPGFHFLALRMQQDDGLWGMLESRGFYISTATGNSVDITAAEYFIDTDPGAGNGIPIPGVSGATTSFTIPVPTSSLSVGFHFLAIRNKDAGGSWGLFESRGFYISGATTEAGQITAAEYFLDTDPGTGNGIAISPVTAGNTLSFTIAVPTTSLATGFHFLAIRTRDADGKWGLFENRGFYISTSTTSAADLDGAEYFIDTDPGTGNGIPLTAGPQGNTLNFIAQIPTAAFSEGFHFLAIRARNTDGTWGLFENRGFYISPAAGDMANIATAEYFIDADPGIGNGSPLTFSAPGPSASQSFICPTPPGLPAGDHLLVIRTQDANGLWGLFDIDTFTISTALSATDLHLDARMLNNSIRLNWSTLSERNTSHFEVEKSKNGVDFIKVAQVKAAGFSQAPLSYEHLDAAPYQGMNYYRIRSLDIDGSVSFSNIATVVNPADDRTIQLYPNPASDHINITADVNKTYTLQLYNNLGQLINSILITRQAIITADIHSLAAGKYYVRLSDGIDNFSGEFIKQ